MYLVTLMVLAVPHEALGAQILVTRLAVHVQPIILMLLALQLYFVTDAALVGPVQELSQIDSLPLQLGQIH